MGHGLAIKDVVHLAVVFTSVNTSRQLNKANLTDRFEFLQLDMEHDDP